MDKFSHRDRRAEQRRPGDRVLPARRVAGLPADRNAVSLSLGGVGGSGGGEGQRPDSAEPLLLSSAFTPSAHTFTGGRGIPPRDVEVGGGEAKPVSLGILTSPPPGWLVLAGARDVQSHRWAPRSQPGPGHGSGRVFAPPPPHACPFLLPLPHPPGASARELCSCPPAFQNVDSTPSLLLSSLRATSLSPADLWLAECLSSLEPGEM